MRLLILGAGQYGQVAKEIAEAMGEYEQIEFLDDNSDIAVGKIEDIESCEYDKVFIAIGDPNVRENLVHRVGDKLVTLIHSNAIIMPSSEVGTGCIIEAGAVVSSRAKIGVSTIVMSNAVVGHDAIVGSYCQLKYNCSVSERCIVPDKKKIECNVVWTQEKV